MRISIVFFNIIFICTRGIKSFLNILACFNTQSSNLIIGHPGGWAAFLHGSLVSYIKTRPQDVQHTNTYFILHQLTLAVI